jgi:hypothetical protein
MTTARAVHAAGSWPSDGKGTPMRVVHGPRSRVLLLGASALAAVTALVSGAAAPAAAAPAGRAGAHQPAAAFGGQAVLVGDSCKGPSWCMVVGSYITTDHVTHALAMILNGTTWRTLKNPPGKHLGGVTCSSTTFCMAAGGPTGAERWNGTTWRTMPSPKGGLGSLTCASRALCMRIHGPLVSVWNGRAWHDATVTNDCNGGPDGPCGLAGVSCGSTTNCVAVGTVTISQEPVQIPLGFFWNGKTWARTEPPGAGEGNPAATNSVICTGGFCMAAGGGFSEVARGNVATAGTWNAAAASWTDVSPNLGTICTMFDPCGWAGPIGCSSSTNCITLGGPDGSQAWNGSGWRSAKPISAGKGSGLQSISCRSGDCLAVGFQKAHGLMRTLAELWNGSAWKIVSTPKGP